MKKSLCVFSSVVLLSLIACQLNAQNWTNEQMEVWNMVVKNNELMYNGDFDGYFANVHADYQGWNNQMPLPVNKTLYKQLMPSDEMVGSIKLDYLMNNPARIVVSGDVAVVHYFFAVTLTMTNDKGSEPINQKGTNTEFFVKEDGKWLLIGDMTVFVEEKDD
jgi:hypothetical protein